MFDDGNRVYPVNKLIMHHAVSDNMVNWDDLAVQDWFSNVGKERGYSNGAVFSYHEHPGRPGQATYSMAHYCLHRYTKDGNKYGWRLTELIKNPMQQVAWHCGNWAANQTSIGIETAGNYSSEDIDDKALMLVADTLGRPWDQELVEAGIPSGVSVYGHKDWFATACPGRIYNKINQLIDMINQGNKWTNILWPPTPPAPVITTKEVVVTETVPFGKKTVNDPTKTGDTITTVGVNGTRKITYTVTLKDGVETGRVIKTNVVAPQPVDEVTTHGTYVPPVEPPKDQPTDYDKEQDSRFSEFVQGVVGFLAAVGKAIADFILKFKKG
jgi:hypothetical protein